MTSFIRIDDFKLIALILTRLTEFNRLTKKLIMLLVDAVLIVLALLASFSLSEDYLYWPPDDLIWIFFGAPFIAIPILMSFRLYQSVVRYIGFKALSSIVQAVSIYSVVWGLLSLMSNHPYMMILLDINSNPFALSGTYFDGISRSVIFLNWLLSLLLISSSRLIARWVFNDVNLNIISKKSNVLIYGAGSAGRQLSLILHSSTEYQHIAYIDDNLAMEKAYIDNIPVFPFNKIQKLIKNNNISEILLAVPLISRKKRKEIIKKLSIFSIRVKSLPSVSELAEGKLKIDDLLEIDVEDLLGRESAKPSHDLLEIKISDKVILITGAGGSIGSELSRQIILLKPKRLVLFEISESALYQIEQELINLNIDGIEICPIIGSVRDFQRLKKIIQFYSVQTIYHAAAYKHVPLVEYNQSEGVLNNSIGTMIAAKAAIAEKVETFVLISTDKAVRPSSTMGATKRVAELILQALEKENNDTCFTMVRFGNVLDSSGSVIPLFKKQIKSNGPVTVTDINMVRYFMTIPEAVQLVIQAGAMGQGGDVFVLDMGKPVKIYDLAVKMIQLSGLQVLDKSHPDGDIEIIFTGLRPGEKLYEELLVGNNVVSTENKLIMRATEEMIEWKKLKPMLDDLETESTNNDLKKIRWLLMKIVPEFNPQYPNEN